MALGRGAQASGHEIPLDSLSDLGPPQPQALLSSLENWCKTQPGSLPGRKEDHMNGHNLNPKSAKPSCSGGSTTFGSHRGTKSWQKWFL